MLEVKAYVNTSFTLYFTKKLFTEKLTTFRNKYFKPDYNRCFLKNYFHV